MGDKLSQNEIDALLNAMQENGSEVIEQMKEESTKKKDFQDYDFASPDKFNVENKKSIESICKTFAKNFGQVLTTRYRSPIEIEIVSIEQISFVPEYTGLPKEQCAFCITDLGHRDLQEIVIEFDLDFILKIHDRALGGTLNRKEVHRKLLSDAEQVTLINLLDNLVYPNLQEAFNTVTETYPRFISYEYDPEFLRITSSTDMAILITFNINHSFWNSTMRLCIPFNAVEGIIEKLTTENVREFKSNKKRKSFEKAMKLGLVNVEEEVKITIGGTEISFEDLKELGVGDVIRLNTKINESSKGYVSDIHRFDCSLGENGIKKAIQVTNVPLYEEKEKIKENEEEGTDGSEERKQFN